MRGGSGGGEDREHGSDICHGNSGVKVDERQ